jgi:chemotaxis protein histidine kinase CheA
MTTKTAKAIVRLSVVTDARLKAVLAAAAADIKKSGAETRASEERDAKAAAAAKAKAAKEAAAAASKAAKEAEAASAKSSKEQARAAVAAAKEQARAAVALAKEEERAVQSVARAKEKAARDAVRAAERAAAATRREAEKTARAQVREAEKAAREQARFNERRGANMRNFVIGTAGAAYGLARGGLDLIGRGQSLAGVGSLEERLATTKQFRQDMIITANEAKVSEKDRKKIEEDVLKASEKTGVSILEMSGALMAAQQNFDKFKEFADIIGELAQVSAGKGMPLKDLVNVVGTASVSLGLTSAEDKSKFIDVLVSTAERGSVEAGAFASNFGSMLPFYTQVTHRTGMEGAREMFAFGQTLGKFHPGAPGEAATEAEALLFKLSEPETQADLLKADVKVTEGGKIGGQMLPFNDIMKNLAESKKYSLPGVGFSIFGRKEPTIAAANLIQAYREDPNAMLKLQNIEEGAGTASATASFEKLRGDASFNLGLIGSQAQAATTRDADRIIKAIEPEVRALTELQNKFPMLSASMGTLEQALRSAVNVLIANTLLGGGGARGLVGAAAAAAGAPGGGVASVLSASVFGNAAATGFGSAVAFSAASIGAALGAGFASYVAASSLLELTGVDKDIEKAGTNLYEDLSGEGAIPRQSSRGFEAPGGFTPAATDAWSRMAYGAIRPEANPLGLSDKVLEALDKDRNSKNEIHILLEDGRARMRSVRSEGPAEVDVWVNTGNATW